MSLSIQIMVQYNNNQTKCLTGFHSPKGLDYTTENEVNNWLLQILTQVLDLEDIKPHKNLYINYNGSYCNNRINQNKKPIEGRVQFITGKHEAMINLIEIMNIVRDNV